MKTNSIKKKKVSGASMRHAATSPVALGSASKKIDKTANERQARRNEKIKGAGLMRGSIVYYKEDRQQVADYARRLWEKRGIVL